MDALKGKKTYLVAAGYVIIAGLRQQGYIDDATYRILEGVLAGAGFAALRAGVTKAGQA